MHKIWLVELEEQAEAQNEAVDQDGAVVLDALQEVRTEADFLGTGEPPVVLRRPKVKAAVKVVAAEAKAAVVPVELVKPEAAVAAESAKRSAE